MGAEAEAVTAALAQARAGDLVVLCVTESQDDTKQLQDARGLGV